MHISHTPVTRHQSAAKPAPKNETPKSETTPQTEVDDSFGFETVATFEFKDGAVSLQDLAGMFSKNEDGSTTLSVPQEVLVDSDAGTDLPPGPNSDPASAGPNGPGPGPEHVTDNAPQGRATSESKPSKADNDGWLLA